MEPNHSLISGLRLVQLPPRILCNGIKNAGIDSDWCVIYANISSSCSSPYFLAWFDLLSILRVLFPITHSSLIASCSANRAHCISSCCWQPKNALSLILMLSGCFRSIFTLCLLYSSLPFKVTWKVFCNIVCCCLAFSPFYVFISSFLQFSVWQNT